MAYYQCTACRDVEEIDDAIPDSCPACGATSVIDLEVQAQREWTEHGGHAARFLFATVSRPSRTAALVTATR